MKLKPPEPKLPPHPLRLSIPGKLMATLEEYARYYEAQHGQAISSDQMVLEMLAAFVASDLGFARWRRPQADAPARRSSAASRTPSAPS
ncbi:MAG: DUF2274 domain-containing protein [Candidatus Binatia bacterium]